MNDKTYKYHWEVKEINNLETFLVYAEGHENSSPFYWKDLDFITTNYFFITYKDTYFTQYFIW